MRAPVKPTSIRGLRRALAAPPADAHGAAWVLAILMITGGVYTVLLALAVPESAGGEVPAAIALAVGLGIAGIVILRLRLRIAAYWWTLVPFLAVAFIVVSNLATSDASTGSQLFVLWPVLYAALYLNATQAAAVIAVSMAGDAAVVLAVLPGAHGMTDAASMTVVSVMATVVIMRLRRRAGTLMDALEAQAREDLLTGLPNRRAFEDALAEAFARQGRDGEPLSLLMLDVDGFKQVNDAVGHAGGDAALREVAGVVRGALRSVDTVARLGGDEFIVLLPGCDGPAAVAVADDLRLAVAAGPSGMTVSVGAASAPVDARDPEGLFRASDAALYTAKHGGRNRVAAA